MVLTEEQKEKQRKYMREWARKDRTKSPEKYRQASKRYREKLGKEEYNRRQREWNKRNPEKQLERDRNYRNKHRQKYNEARLNQIKRKWIEVMTILGDVCSICKHKGKRRVSCHEIYGKPHKGNPWYVLKHIERFIPLCDTCHKSVHRYHEYKKEIEELEKKMI